MIGQSDKSQSRRLPVFLVGCAAVACCLVLLVLLGHGPGRQVVESIDRAAVDVMFRFRGPAETTGRVVIVTIDEKSLAALGQWPWPRDLTGQLLRRIAADKPRVIGMDVLFAEPDRTDPKRGPSLVRDLLKDKPQVEPAELDNDGRLAAASATTMSSHVPGSTCLPRSCRRRTLGRARRTDRSAPCRCCRSKRAPKATATFSRTVRASVVLFLC